MVPVNGAMAKQTLIHCMTIGQEPMLNRKCGIGYWRKKDYGDTPIKKGCPTSGQSLFNWLNHDFIIDNFYGLKPKKKPKNFSYSLVLAC